jgi:WD40 repeat protein/tRNA A-37 threonylcarbamoyl transferase component Bud32
MSLTIGVGQQLGNYRLIRLIGQGGFADVYLGEHIHLNNFAAIKILKAQLTQSEMKNFRDEARTMMELIHPSIVRVHDFGVEPGSNTPFLVMNYASGGSLRQSYPRGTRLSAFTILSSIKQVAEALQYVHDQHLIHRDVKPENMLLGRNNAILLSDFGIAIASHNIGVAAVGTAAYMAPEQNAFRPCPASDQYALGITVFEWLCGVRPFTGSSNVELAQKHAYELPPPLRSINPTISLAIESVVLNALAKDPTQRYASIKDFADEFEKASSALSVPAAPTAPFAQQPANPPTVPLNFPQQGNIVPLTPTIPVPSNPQVSNVRTTVRLLQPTKGRQGDTLYIHKGHDGFFAQAVAWSPDNSCIVSAGDDASVQVWDAFTGSNLCTFREHHDQVWAVAWSHNGDRVVSGSVDQIAHVWEVASGSVLTTYQAHAGHAIGIGLAFAVAWSPDVQYIASGSADKTVHIWNAQTGDNHSMFHGHSAEVNAVAWSPDGKYIATASDDKTACVWDVIAQSTIYTFEDHSRRVRAVAWSPDGNYIATASDDTTVRVWNVHAGNQESISLYRGHTKRVRGVAWSPDSTFIASASNDTTIQIWDALTRDHIYTYRGHTSDINALVWSPNGEYIASASDDGTVHVWQAHS